MKILFVQKIKMSFDNIVLSFHVGNKIIQNTKYFIYKDKKYPIDFDLLKKNSQFFYRNEKQFTHVNEIDLLNGTDEALLDIPEEAIQAFIASCCNQPCKIQLSDVIPLQYLSHKFEFIELIKITDKYFEVYSNNLVLPSILFKLKIGPNNQRKSELNKIPPYFYNIEKEVEIISMHLNDFVQNPEMLLLPISILDQIFNRQYQFSQKVKKNSNEVIEFLFKCLDKYEIDASILFSYVDFGEQSIGVINRLIHNYSNKFDFNMINSTLLKTTTQLTSEVNKMKEEFSFLFSQMTQKFNEQQNEIIRMKEEEERKAKCYEELMNQMKEEIEKSKEREKIFNEKMIELTKCEKELKKKEENKEEEKNKEEENKEEEKNKEKEKNKEEENNERNNNFDQPYTIFVKTLNNKHITIQVQPTTTIEEIKDIIYEKIKIKQSLQCLTYANKSLNDECSLIDYNIIKDSTINLSLHVSNYLFTINVKRLTGKIYVIDCGMDNTVNDIKKRIEKKTGYTPSQQILVFNGKLLDDELTLKKCDIYHGYTIHLVLKRIKVNK